MRLPVLFSVLLFSALLFSALLFSPVLIGQKPLHFCFGTFHCSDWHRLVSCQLVLGDCVNIQ